MNQEPSATPMPHAEPDAVQLHSLFSEAVRAAKEMLPPGDAQQFSRISIVIPRDLPELHLDVAQARTFALLLALSALQNSREGSAVVISAKANRQTVDVTLTLTPNPMFVLLSRGTRDSIEKSLDVSTLSNASDPYVSFHAARMLGVTMQLNTWVETIPPDKAVLHAYFPLNELNIPDPAVARKVLVIEDNRQISMLLELYLKHEGFETHAAINGVLGLAMAKDIQPDLITLDVMMPEMDGWQALRELKTAPESCHIPVVVISVLRDVQIGFEFGASGYLTKPVNRADLVAAVHRLMAKPLLFTIPRKGAYKTASVFPASADFRQEVATATGAEHITSVESIGKILGVEDLREEHHPDAFLIDARMQPMLAIAAANRVRVYSGFADIPVVAVADGAPKKFLSAYGAGLFSAVTEINGLPAAFDDRQPV